VVKVKNSTVMPEGIVISDSDKKSRDNGEKYKYILEKEASGWKVAQVYEYSQYHASISGGDPWEKVFAPPTENRNTHVYVYHHDN